MKKVIITTLNEEYLRKAPVEVAGHMRVISGHRFWVNPYIRHLEVGRVHTVKGQDYSGFKYEVTGTVIKDDPRYVTVQGPGKVHLIDKETIQEAHERAGLAAPKGWGTFTPWGHVSRADRATRQEAMASISARARISKEPEFAEAEGLLNKIHRQEGSPAEIEAARSRFNELANTLNAKGYSDREMERAFMEKPRRKVGESVQVTIPSKDIRYSGKYAGKELMGTITKINRATYEVTIEHEDGRTRILVPREKLDQGEIKW